MSELAGCPSRLDVQSAGCPVGWMSSWLDVQSAGCLSRLDVRRLDVFRLDVRVGWTSSRLDVQSAGCPFGWISSRLDVRRLDVFRLDVSRLDVRKGPIKGFLSASYSYVVYIDPSLRPVFAFFTHKSDPISSNLTSHFCANP